MQRFERGPAPELLAKYGEEITRDYIEKKTVNAKYDFNWPQRDGRSIYSETRDALRFLTDQRCSYCDGYPVDATGEGQVDHFKPKHCPAFFELVCEWTNLFFVCSACNKQKLGEWSPELLRPDADDFEFDRFFIYRSETGELLPNPGSSLGDQRRAEKTIEVLRLNRPGLCVDRRRTAKVILSCDRDDLALWGYRFLLPLCRTDVA